MDRNAWKQCTNVTAWAQQSGGKYQPSDITAWFERTLFEMVSGPPPAGLNRTVIAWEDVGAGLIDGNWSGVAEKLVLEQWDGSPGVWNWDTCVPLQQNGSVIIAGPFHIADTPANNYVDLWNITCLTPRAEQQIIGPELMVRWFARRRCGVFFSPSPHNNPTPSLPSCGTTRKTAVAATSLSPPCRCYPRWLRRGGPRRRWCAGTRPTAGGGRTRAAASRAASSRPTPRRTPPLGSSARWNIRGFPRHGTRSIKIWNTLNSGPLHFDGERPPVREEKAQRVVGGSRHVGGEEAPRFRGQLSVQHTL